MKKKRIALFIISLFIISGIGGFIGWASFPAKPLPEALGFLTSDSNVQVSSQKWYIFSPKQNASSIGFIIYPGGRVDPRAYAPTAYHIAAAGYFVVIVPMLLNLAVFSPNRALEVMNAFSNITTWVIGGHSLGGAMAASFISSHIDVMHGLMFWASYPANNMSTLSIPVLSISASLDGLSTPAKINVSKANLPLSTIFYEIEGGNHAQFGYYGEQQGDNSATISRTEQQSQIVNATLDFLSSIMSD